MIRNIIFDIGGVLIDLNPQRTLQGFARLTTQPVGTFTDNELLGGGGNHLIGQYMCGDVSDNDFFLALQHLCHTGVTVAQIKAVWNDMLLGIPPERVEMIKQLHQHGIRIALLSNINEEHVRTTLRLFAEADLEIGRDIDYAFFSNEMHLAKPDPAIYQEALRQTGFLPEQTLYIDDLLPNIEAGAAFGLQTLHATGNEWIAPVCAQCLQ